MDIPGSKEEGMKFDTGKPRAGLCIKGFQNALNEVSKVTTFGTKKYAPNNWQFVKNANERYSDALFRHLLEDGNDPESGLKHLAHAAWNLLAILELELRKEKQE